MSEIEKAWRFFNDRMCKSEKDKEKIINEARKLFPEVEEYKLIELWYNKEGQYSLR